MVTVKVLGYDDLSDDFEVKIDIPEAPCQGAHIMLNSVALACMVRQWGEPAEFIGETFKIDF